MLLLNKSGGASCIGANGLPSPFPCSLDTADDLDALGKQSQQNGSPVCIGFTVPDLLCDHV